jgi:hypothetical protein
MLLATSQVGAELIQDTRVQSGVYDLAGMIRQALVFAPTVAMCAPADTAAAPAAAAPVAAGAKPVKPAAVVFVLGGPGAGKASHAPNAPVYTPQTPSEHPLDSP